MEHTIIVRVSLTSGGYVRVEIVDDKPDGRYVGRVAMREHVINIYAVRMMTAQRDLHIIYKVIEWMDRRGIL